MVNCYQFVPDVAGKTNVVVEFNQIRNKFVPVFALFE